MLKSFTDFMNQYVLFGPSATLLVTLLVFLVNVVFVVALLRSSNYASAVSVTIMSGILWCLLLVYSADNAMRSRVLDNHDNFVWGMSPDVWAFIFLVVGALLIIPLLFVCVYCAKRAESRYAEKYHRERARFEQRQQKVLEHKSAMRQEKVVRQKYVRYLDSDGMKENYPLMSDSSSPLVQELTRALQDAESLRDDLPTMSDFTFDPTEEDSPYVAAVRRAEECFDRAEKELGPSSHADDNTVDSE